MKKWASSQVVLLKCVFSMRFVSFRSLFNHVYCILYNGIYYIHVIICLNWCETCVWMTGALCVMTVYIIYMQNVMCDVGK